MIISGLKETFIKRYIVERIIKAEKDQTNRMRNQRDVWRIYGTKSVERAIKTEIDTRDGALLLD